MNTRRVGLILLIFASFLVACGGTAGKGTGKKSKTFRAELGLTMQGEFNEAVDMMVYGRYRYVRSGDSRNYPNLILFHRRI